MADIVVTGAAGFVGSHLSEQLIARGHRVTGIDAFIPYYPRSLKERNLSSLLSNPQFDFHEVDLRTADVRPLLADADAVFHLAAMAGLLRSWQEFDDYMTCNVQATQHLLEAAIDAEIPHFLQISTSSVYGRFATSDETSPTAPISPYGITKLAAEHLCLAYAENYGLPVTILRLFSVYGPRQRPDMGYNIFIRSILQDELITIDGDGNDSRSNTFVQDCAQGLILAFEQPQKSIGEIFNIGGGEEVNVNQALEILENLAEQEARITHGPRRPGDQRRTVADTAKARRLLGYDPSTTVVDGLAAQMAWQRQQMGLVE
jgi:UDP-glucuronate 4-epimerase